MTATRARAIAAVVAAVLGAILTQGGESLGPVVTIILVASLAGLAAADWTAIIEGRTE